MISVIGFCFAGAGKLEVIDPHLAPPARRCRWRTSRGTLVRRGEGHENPQTPACEGRFTAAKVAGLS